MDTYYFKSIPPKYKAAYQKYYMLQNLNTAQVACILFFCLNLAIRIFTLIVPPTVTRIHNYPEFNLTNWACLALTPLFYLAGRHLIKRYHKGRSKQPAALGYMVAFCLFLLACGMLFSFIAASDPGSSMIIYLVTLIAVVGVYTFEYQETLLLTIVNALMFTMLILFIRADPTEILYKELLLVVLSGIFFFVSRHIYSYRAGEYLQYRIIKQKNMEIEKASAFKNDVLGMVAHDLRNPIGAIESITLLMEMDDLDDDTRENTGMIKASCRKALSIINDLLEVARNDNSDVMSNDVVNVNQLLQEVAQVWRHINGFQNPLVLTLPPQPVFAHINTEKFQRVLDNLISNAAKFSKEEDAIDIKLSANNQQVKIEVADHGVGIPAALIHKIFDRFSKAGRKGLKGEQSTGLGLSIARQIVERHQGRIEVQSEEDKGTTFIITLPAIPEG